jgi:hypothetical protein
MSSTIIYERGGLAVDIPVGAGESIAIYTRDVAQVTELVGFANQPTKENLVNTVIDAQVVLGPYTDATILRINAGADRVLYQVGTAPVITELKGQRLQEDPQALDATGTLTAALILGGIVTSTTASAVTATLDTGTVMDAAMAFGVSDSFDWSAINTGGANAFTVTASSGHTVVGSGAVAATSSATFRTRKTAEDTFVTYRIA